MANQAESSQDWAEERWAIDAKEKSMATESNKLARWCGRVDVVLILGAICRLREKYCQSATGCGTKAVF